MLVRISVYLFTLKGRTAVKGIGHLIQVLGFAVTIARFSDTVGRKPALLMSFFIFLAGSMACGASKSIEQLIGFRALQGIGGAGLYSMTMIIYPEITPASMVPLISALIGMIVAFAGVSGPVIGGLLTTYADWRYAFWIKYVIRKEQNGSYSGSLTNESYSGPCAFVPLVALFFLWPKRFQTFTKTQFKQIDYLGIVLIMLGTVLPVFIMNQAAIREYAWNSATTIVIFIISGAAWIILVVWQWQLSKSVRFSRIRPQFPFQLMTDRVMLSVFLYVHQLDLQCAQLFCLSFGLI